MVASGMKPGVPVVLRELEPSSPFFKHGQSLRVTGRLEAYQAETGIAEISDGNVKLKIDTRHLTDLIFCAGSLYQFIGELVLGFNTNDLQLLKFVSSGEKMALFPTQEHKRITTEAIAKLNAAYPTPSYATVTANFSTFLNPPTKPTDREINVPCYNKGLHFIDEPKTTNFMVAHSNTQRIPLSNLQLAPGSIGNLEDGWTIVQRKKSNKDKQSAISGAIASSCWEDGRRARSKSIPAISPPQ